MGQDARARLGGLVLLAVGLGFGWFFVLGPLRAAQAGAAQIEYQMKALILVPFSLVFGLAYLLRGGALEFRRADGKNLTTAGWVLFAITAVLTALLYWWFDHTMKGLGYR